MTTRPTSTLALASVAWQKQGMPSAPIYTDPTTAA
jgi:hypothetical protein